MRGNSKGLHMVVVAAALIGLGQVGCDAQEPVSPDQRALEELRGAMAGFQDVAAAHEAGYEVLVVHPTSGARCLDDPEEGGMGFHYLDGDLADGTVAVASPEVVIYEPDADGGLTLVAVEYIVPFAVRGEGEEPPVLFGREFSRNHTFDLWALHAWAWKDNPSGVFADYNPEVSCQHADAVS